MDRFSNTGYFSVKHVPIGHWFITENIFAHFVEFTVIIAVSCFETWTLLLLHFETRNGATYLTRWLSFVDSGVTNRKKNFPCSRCCFDLWKSLGPLGSTSGFGPILQHIFLRYDLIYSQNILESSSPLTRSWIRIKKLNSALWIRLFLRPKILDPYRSGAAIQVDFIWRGSQHEEELKMCKAGNLC